MGFIKNKKTLMCLAALQIIIFHLWAMIGNSTAELFIRKTAYMGVDIFFFLSAYSLTVRGMSDLKGYYRSRFTSVYMKFVIFVLAAAVIKGFSPARTIMILSGIDMLVNGGGGFLGFIPAIMLFYLIFPLVHGLIRPRPLAGSLAVLAVYIAGGILATQYLDLPSLYIFWNRIPVLVCGFLAAVYSRELAAFFQGKKGMIRRLITGGCLVAAGIPLLYRFGFTVRLMVPVNEMYYVAALPMVLGLILLADLIPAVKPVRLIGDATLEMYAIQMIWGFSFANIMFSRTGSAAVTDLVTIAFVAAAGVLFSQVYKYIAGLPEKMKRSSAG